MCHRKMELVTFGIWRWRPRDDGGNRNGSLLLLIIHMKPDVEIPMVIPKHKYTKYLGEGVLEQQELGDSK